MTNAVLFKALHRQTTFRNSDCITHLDDPKAQLRLSKISQSEILVAQEYISRLTDQGINYTYPGDLSYPQIFYKLIEPPLFLEYLGEPVWLKFQTLSVVGARKILDMTEKWMFQELSLFLNQYKNVCLVSGGAQGVDQTAHKICIKNQRPTVVVLPCGILNLFPQDLKFIKKYILEQGGCFLSEFESEQSVKKSFFYFRNRLIAGLSLITLVTQAERKSGSLLTVHHGLQNGKVILTLPAHPYMTEFSGNHYLMNEGAFYVQNFKDMQNFWDAECWSGRVELAGHLCR